MVKFQIHYAINKIVLSRAYIVLPTSVIIKVGWAPTRLKIKEENNNTVE